MPPSPAVEKPHGRVIALDILRGFLLLWMTLTHLPTRASLISNQTFGFVSGAEGFIFLAGFMVGQLEYRREHKGGEIATLRDLAKRTARIYAYHVGLLVIAFTIFSRIAVDFNRLAIQNLLSFYLHSPGKAWVAGLALVYRPSLLDILPMYIVFMVATPLARRVAHRRGWSPVIYICLGIWIAAQFGLRHFVYTHISLFGLHVPEDSIGAFDLFAWQLLWMVALALGTRYADDAERGGQPASNGVQPWLLRLSIAVAIMFLLLRYSSADQLINSQLLGFLTDKWRLGPARVVNFAAIAIVLARYGSQLASFKLFAPLALLGQASLEVFSVHILCCLVGDSLGKAADPQLPPIVQTALLIGTISALFATALLVRRVTEARRRRVLNHANIR